MMRAVRMVTPREFLSLLETQTNPVDTGGF